MSKDSDDQGMSNFKTLYSEGYLDRFHIRECTHDNQASALAKQSGARKAHHCSFCS